MINIEEKSRIKDFIHNPIKAGIWETFFEWKEQNIIENKLDNFFGYNYNIQYFDPLDILDLFIFLIMKNKIEETNQPRSIRKKFFILNENEILFNKLDDYDLKKISNNFKILKEKTNLINNYTRLSNIGFIINGEYAHIYQLPKNKNNSFTFLSTSEKISNTVIDIFESCQCFFNFKKRLIYSPKNKLAMPLFDFTNFVSNSIFLDWEKKHFFYKAYNAYNQKDYDSSISYIGKMTESLLTNIYESIFKEYVHEDFTIGKILDNIQTKVKNTYKNDTNEIKPANFEEIIIFIKENKDFKVESAIMKITNLLKDEQKYRNSLAKETKTFNDHYNIFPKNILKNLKNILKYRNAVSHNSGEFFDDIDCEKTLFYFLSVYNWWEKIYGEIEWNNKKEKIINMLIENKKIYNF